MSGLCGFAISVGVFGCVFFYFFIVWLEKRDGIHWGSFYLLLLSYRVFFIAFTSWAIQFYDKERQK